MSVITYPDGSTLTSTALTKNQIETLLQVLTCQLLGIVAMPWTVSFVVTAGEAVGTTASLTNLYAGQVISCPGLPPGTRLNSVEPINRQLYFSNPATATGNQYGTVVDPLAFSKVRIGWQQQGQAGWGVNDDIAFVRCTPVDADYSRGRDGDTIDTPEGTKILQSDNYTRQWRTAWCFYGPNSIDSARAVRAALGRASFADTALAAMGLYVNPSIAEITRVPEMFQGQWWERVDLAAIFNEDIRETVEVNAVASVEVFGFIRQGQFTDVTVTAATAAAHKDDGTFS
jgi:hypothetical protein